MLARHLPRSKVVKAFNAIIMPHFDRDGQPAGSFDRRALPSPATTRRRSWSSRACMIDSGSIRSTSVPSARAGASSPDTPVYCIRFNRDWIRRALAEAAR